MRCLNVLVREVVQLLVNQFVDDLPQLHHTSYTAFGVVGQFDLRHDRVLSVVDLAINDRIAKILHSRVCGQRFALCFRICDVRGSNLHRSVITLDVLYRLGKLVCKAGALDGCNGQVVTILGAFHRELPQHHLRVVYKILVDGKAIFRFAKLHPVWLMVDGAVTLLQKDNVRNHFGSGIRLERIVGQTDGPQQVGTLCHVLAGGAVLAVHGIARSHKRHDAARTHLVDGFRKEIVVDAEAQFVICLVCNFIIAKRDVAHCKVIEIPAVGGFKTCYRDVSLRVQLLRNASGDAVQFHTIQAAVLHGVRQHPEKVADTHAGFQNIAATESHFFYCIIDGTDNGGAGIVCIQHRPTGGGVLVLRKHSFQFGVLLCPVVFVGVKGICQTAPADILRQHFLLLGRSTTVFFFQTEQRFDGLDVPGVLLLCTALAQMLISNVKIPSGFRHRFCVEGFIQGCGIRESLNFAINHRRDRQFIQFLIGQFRLIRLLLPQSLLKLLPVDDLVIPRMTVRTGVDAHIGFTNIADGSFNCSGGKVYYNFVPDLIADLFFGNQLNGCVLLFFVQFPDVRQMLVAENGQSVFRQLHVLQADGFEHKINVFHPKIPVIQLDDAANR